MKLKHDSTYKNVQLIIGLFVVTLSFCVFLLFNTYRDEILQANAFFPFIVLTIILMGLLMGLLFLTNNSLHVPQITKSSSKKKSKKKK